MEAVATGASTSLINEAFRDQQANRWKMAATTTDERIERLRKLKRAMLDRRDELFDALYADFRKDRLESEATELHAVLVELNHTIKHLRGWMKPRRVPTPLLMMGTSGEVRPEPRGLVVILSPWNYPFLLTMTPLLASISAGNCNIVKPSEKAPATAAFMTRLVTDVLPRNEVAFFEGGAEVASQLLDLPFDHFFFTGGGRVGRIVMQAAAKHLASCTLELGGKSPVIVDRTANLEDTAEKIAWGKFLNGGQTCVAPDYLLVDRAIAEPLSRALNGAISKMYGSTDGERRASKDFCRMIDRGAFERLEATLADAISRGARVFTGGEAAAGERYVSPTLLTDVAPDARVMQEEIFGPILPIIPYDSLDEAIRLIQSKDKPLSLYIFSEDDATIERVLRETSAGGTAINNVVLHFAHPELPLGGAGASGIGSYHGEWGFRELSHLRAVLRQGRFAPIKVYYPPYGKKTERIFAWIRRYLG